MYLLLIGLIVLAALLMCFVVLIQNSKGGGLASSFASSNQIMGVRKTTDFLEKATWVLAAALFVFSISATAFIPRQAKTGGESEIKDQIQNAVDPTQVPTFPAPAAADTKATPAETTPAPATTPAPETK